MLATAIVAAAVLVFIVEAVAPRLPVDDAYISFRYARNLVEGVGLVYNVGEYVEGFTNLLWTLLVAAGIAMGLDAVAVAQWLEIGAGVGVLVLATLYARTILRHRRSALAAVATVVLVAAPSFAYWAPAGLGEPLFVCLVTATLLADAVGRPGWMTALAFAATLARPEGVLTALVVFSFHLWRHRDRGWYAIRFPIAYALGIAGLTAFRLLYYGAPVPNTFYAKVGGVPVHVGAEYLLRFLRQDGALPLALLALPALRHDHTTWPAGFLTASTAVYVVTIGGDVFPYGRFLLPTLPVLAGLALCGVSILYDRRPWLGALATTGIAMAIGSSLLGGTMPTSADTLWPNRWPRNAALARQKDASAKLVRGATALGYRIGAMKTDRGTPPLVASGMIGALGYYSRVPIIDIFGLIDPVIARDRRPPPPGATLRPGHHRSNPEYVLGRNPDLAVSLPRQLQSRGSPAVVDLLSSPEFQRRYIWDQSLLGYRRRPGTQPHT